MTLLCLSLPTGLVGQEPEAPAPLAEDTLVGELEGELTGTLADSAALEQYPQIARELLLPADGWSWTTYDWDREAILRSNALTLLDLLSQVVPGLTEVRATWFGGPHHVLAGGMGPGFVSVAVDGRELTNLDAGQIDLTRVGLANVDRVRVRRRADGWMAQVTTLRREQKKAYSRITGGTGDPGLSRLRLVFGNGAGQHFNVGTSIDLLDVGGEQSSNDFNFWGRLEWLPGKGDSGLELHWSTESVERTVYEPDEFSRKELFLRGRGNLGPHVQAEAFVGTTSLTRSDESVQDLSHAGFRLTGLAADGWFRSSVRLWDDPVFPLVDGDLELGYRIFPALSVTAGGRLTSWDAFDAAEVRAGLATDLIPGRLRIAAEGVTGTRGVAYPTLERSDSVSFDAASGELTLRLGPFSLSGRGEYQRLSRQLPFGAEFDRDQPVGGQVELGITEGSVSGPLIPLGRLLDGAAPISLRGFWRYARILQGQDPMYLPRNLARGEVFWNDSFFNDELEFHAGFGLSYRDPMWTAPAPGSAMTAPVEVPSYTYVDWNLMIRILEVRIYWRFDNLAITEGQDLPGLPFPVRRSVFGVKWEFLN